MCIIIFNGEGPTDPDIHEAPKSTAQHLQLAQLAIQKLRMLHGASEAEQRLRSSLFISSPHII